jgi:RecA/RadA recombinase
MSFLSNLVKKIEYDGANVLEDGRNSSEISDYIDSGSLMFNALLSGSLFGGLPGNRVTCFAGETSVGKTYFTLDILHRFLTDRPDGIVSYFDTEAAVKKSTFEQHGCDPSRIAIVEPETVEQFRNLALKILEAYSATDEKTRPKMVMVLDSLGMLSSEKEMTDSLDGHNVVDMTRPKAIRATFRTLTLKLAKARVPLIMTNHTYDSTNPYAGGKQIAGGGGVKYAASSIIVLSRKKEKEGTEVIGNIITAKAEKSRLSKENSSVELKLTYKHGLDRHYGLLDLATRHGILPSAGGRYTFPDGSKHFAKAVYGDPERFFVPELMDRLEQAAQREFQYGSTTDNDSVL